MRRRVKTTSRALDKDAEALRLQLEPIFDQFQQEITALQAQVTALQNAVASPLLVLEQDGSPSIQTTALLFNQADGFIVTNPGPGQALVSITTASYTDEDARDAISAALIEGAGIDITVSDVGNTITIASTITQYTDENARDAIGAALVEGAGIDITVSDVGDTITVDVDISEIARWETVREIDFNAWPDTNFATGGDTTYSLNDGSGAVTWLADATANANAAGAVTANCGFFRKNAADVGDDGASGLRIAHDTGTSTSLSSSTIPGGGSGPPRLSALLTDLVSDYSPTEEYRIEIHITRLTDRATAPINAGIHIAVGAPTNSPTGASAARLGSAAMQRNGANEGAPTVNTSTGSAMKVTDAAYAFTNGAAGSTRNDVLAVTIRPGNIVTAYVAGPYSGGWPAETTYRCCGTGLTGTLSTTAAIDMMSRGTYVTIAADSRTSVAGCVDFMVRRMRVSRRVR